MKLEPVAVLPCEVFLRCILLGSCWSCEDEVREVIGAADLSAPPSANTDLLANLRKAAAVNDPGETTADCCLLLYNAALENISSGRDFTASERQLLSALVDGVQSLRFTAESLSKVIGRFGAHDEHAAVGALRRIRNDGTTPGCNETKTVDHIISALYEQAIERSKPTAAPVPAEALKAATPATPPPPALPAGQAAGSTPVIPWDRIPPLFGWAAFDRDGTIVGAKHEEDFTPAPGASYFWWDRAHTCQVVPRATWCDNYSIVVPKWLDTVTKRPDTVTKRPVAEAADTAPAPAPTPAPSPSVPASLNVTEETEGPVSAGIPSQCSPEARAALRPVIDWSIVPGYVQWAAFDRDGTLVGSPTEMQPESINPWWHRGTAVQGIGDPPCGSIHDDNVPGWRYTQQQRPALINGPAPEPAPEPTPAPTPASTVVPVPVAIPPIPWHRIPDDYTWAAFDRDGAVVGGRSEKDFKPNLVGSPWWCRTDDVAQVCARAEGLCGSAIVVPNWQETVTARPPRPMAIDDRPTSPAPIADAPTISMTPVPVSWTLSPRRDWHIPWADIKEGYDHAAFDADGELVAFKEPPVITPRSDIWCRTAGNYYVVERSRGRCDAWANSRSFRPKDGQRGSRPA